MDFFDVAKTRRSVRVFTKDKIPDEVMNKSIDTALLAPNSSNMQTWEFYWVKSSDKKNKLIEACLNQTAARSAAELVVAVANPKKWKRNNQELIKILKKNNVPAPVLQYYGKLMPFIYGLQIIAPIKWLIFNIMGIFKPTPRKPWSARDRQEVAIKSCALACQNFMLAMSAQGYDSCPMEGFDEKRVKKILGLGCSSRVVMVIATGKRSDDGVWGKQLRLPKEWAVFNI